MSRPEMRSADAPCADPTESLIRRARRVEIKSRRLVSLAMTGEYRSAFRGTGVEFETVREYVFGDDVRGIDWNVTARVGRPFVKQFVEARERSVVLVVDRSASMDFGSERRSKADVAAELCAVLALAAGQHHDRVGLLRFTDRVEGWLPPARGAEWPRRILRELYLVPVHGRRSALAVALRDLERRLLRRHVLFLISDFHDEVPVDLLARLRRRHDVVAAWVSDPRERELDGDGLIDCVDPETGRQFRLDAASASERLAFARLAQRRRAVRQEALCRAGVDLLAIDTADDLLPVLLRFFERRLRRR